MTSLPEKPSFDELPLRKDGPRGNAWGLYGPNDQLGMLNQLTPERVKAAAQEIQEGVRISTDLHLDALVKPFFGRVPVTHNIHKKVHTNDCTVQFNTQVSTQWDGFRHYAYHDHMVFFNGYEFYDMIKTHVNGAHGRFDRLRDIIYVYV